LCYGGHLELRWHAAWPSPKPRNRACLRRLIRIIALSLGLPGMFFEPFFQPGMTVMRANFYPAVVSDPATGTFGVGAHSDYGMLTLLRTTDAPGLQANVDGVWQDVPPMCGPC
jgi:isopenicillin N synthase-like dioxygenase